MNTNAVNWFEIPVKDIERAKKFYESLLNVEMQDIPMPNMQITAFPMIEKGEYATGAIVKSENHEPSTTGTLVYFACEDVNSQLDKVESLGGKIVSPKMSIGEFGFTAHITDTEGNKVALHSVK